MNEQDFSCTANDCWFRQHISGSGCNILDIATEGNNNDDVRRYVNSTITCAELQGPCIQTAKLREHLNTILGANPLTTGDAILVEQTQNA